MQKLLERLRTDFQGNGDALITTAQEVARNLGLTQEATEGNERLLRHYVSMGVVDKPSREGRDALYGFRHLVQFVAARRLLAEGFALAKIAKFTAVLPTDNLARYLEKPDRTSEAELLVAAFRSEKPERKALPVASRRSAPASAMPSPSTGSGMVDVMHEMREMERRVQAQLSDFQDRVHAMVSKVLNSTAATVHQSPLDPDEFRDGLSKLMRMMDENIHRFDDLMRKPMAMIERQMEQQRYLFEEAHRQKDFLEHMFQGLLRDQQGELNKVFDMQMHRLESVAEMNQKILSEMLNRMEDLDAVQTLRFNELQDQIEQLRHQPPPNPEQKEGAV